MLLIGLALHVLFSWVKFLILFYSPFYLQNDQRMDACEPLLTETSESPRFSL